MNFPIKLGVPFFPSHIAHPYGIVEDYPLNIIILPLGNKLFIYFCTHSVEAKF
jgi:hypothetical protein